jgi:ATP-binding protein involved in chromosome partitioning
LAVASGKGGVGKSTTAVNLSVAMAAAGAAVGLMDADIYGPNVPLMMGAKDRPDMSPQHQLLPLVRHGVKFISLGLIAGDGVPVVWRGPMLAKMVTQFLHDVAWAPLDCLVIDLPPGTGDVQLTLTQTAPISGAVIVTTPQAVALDDVRRGIQMFATVGVPVLGILENMSGYRCPGCGKVHALFGEGGGRQTASRYDVPFLGEIPLDPEIGAGADTGRPAVVARPESETARQYLSLADDLLKRLESA